MKCEQTVIDFLKNILRDENGAVTVDWVVLTAAVVGLGVAAVTTTKGGITSLATKINTDVSNVSIGKTK